MKNLLVIIAMVFALSSLSTAQNISFAATFKNVAQCPNGAKGSITIRGIADYPNGYPPYTYSDDGGISFQRASSLATPISVFSGLTAGTYIIKVKDAHGNISNPTNITIATYDTIAVNPLIIDATGSNIPDGKITVNCSDGSGTFIYSINGGINYQSSKVFTGLLPNTYNVIVKDADGCYSGVYQVIVGN
jgi:hypothetical protein